MQYVGKVFSTVSQLYKELNPATLSGAIDIIVVEGKDGELFCSPFHVRFGKLQLLRPSDKAVQVIVNDEPAEFYMKVGDSGEGFFVLETEGDVPSEFATSPLASPSLSFKQGEDPDFLDLSGNVNSEDHNKDGYVSAPSAHESEDEASSVYSSHLLATEPALAHSTGSAMGIGIGASEHHLSVRSSRRRSASVSIKEVRFVRASEEHTSKCSMPEADSARTALYSEHGDGMWLPRDETEEPEMPTFSDDMVVGTKFHGRIMHQLSEPGESEGEDGGIRGFRVRSSTLHNPTTPGVDSSMDDIGAGRNPLEAQMVSAAPRHRRPLSVVSDSAYVLDPFSSPSAAAAVGSDAITDSSVLVSGAAKASSSALHSDWDWGVSVSSHGPKTTAETKRARKSKDMPKAAATPEPVERHTLDTTQILHRDGAQARQLEISLCGVESLQGAVDKEAQERVFTQSLVSAQAFSQDPMAVITNPNVVFRMSGDVYTQGEPLVASLISQLAFGQPLQDSFVLSQPKSGTSPVVTMPASYRESRHAEKLESRPDGTSEAQAAVAGESAKYATAAEAADANAQLGSVGSDTPADSEGKVGAQEIAAASKPEGRRWWRWGQRATSTPKAGDGQDSAAPSPLAQAKTLPAQGHEKLGRDGGGYSSGEDNADAVTINIPPAGDFAPADGGMSSGDEGGGGAAGGYMSDDGQLSHSLHHHMHYAKTLRLTSDQLKSLGLKRGANDVKFLVPSNNAYCEAKIFFYRHDTQVVISDIDGTITKSDALGHLFNMVGKDWTHQGVAKLYTDIASNGYEILYLTSRAIGQADGTRYFLNNVKQGQYKLPTGPLLLSPDRLFTSFHREVIMRRPHEFKMACLRDIKNLFGDYSPFYAGFGNRITDAMSYRSVNVPVSRICTIDPSGEIKLELLPGYKSSYVKMNDLVDLMFPALSTKLDPKFNDWEYWKSSLPLIDDELAEIEKQIEEENEAKKQQELLAKKKQKPKSGAGEDISGRKSPANGSVLLAVSTSGDGVASSSPEARSPSIFTRATRAVSSVQPPVAAAAALLPSSPLLTDPETPETLARQRADSWATVSTPTRPAAAAPIGIGTPDQRPAVARNASTTSTASNASNAPPNDGGGRMSMLKKVNVFSPFSLVRGSSPPPPALPPTPTPTPALAAPAQVLQSDAAGHGASLPPKFEFEHGSSGSMLGGSPPPVFSGSAFPPLGASPPSDLIAAASTFDFAGKLKGDLAASGAGTGDGSAESIADDPAVAAAASRLIPQIARGGVAGAPADDAANSQVLGASAPDGKGTSAGRGGSDNSREDECLDSEYSDDEDVDSEIDDDDEDEEEEDELDQETLAIMHDMDEIQYL